MTYLLSRRLPVVLTVLLMCVAGVFMLNTAASDAPIMDELPHIPAGYSYVRFLDYRLNPEHPPLLKALAALPLLTQNLTFPLTSKEWTTEVNGQWDIGRLFLYGSGNDPDSIVFGARLAPIFLSLLLILLVFIWARELLGGWWALVPTFLFALSPTVLAHGHYVTTDIAATFGVIVSSYFFLKNLLHPSRGHLILAGVGFAIAQLLKFSLFLLVPYFILLTGVYWIAKALRDEKDGRVRRAFRDLWRHVRSLVLIFLIGYLIVYAAYAVLTLNYPADKQLSDTRAIVNSFVSPPWFPGLMDTLIENPITRPFGHYILGLSMVFVRASGGNTGYFLGTVTNVGWWYYFPVVFFLKESLPSLILMLIASGVGVLHLVRRSFMRARWRAFLNYLGTNFTEFALLVFIGIYWVASMKSPLNIGVRHILPTLPLFYILATGGLKVWLSTHRRTAALEAAGGTPSVLDRFSAMVRDIGAGSLKFVIIGALLVWYAGETVASAPYFLSYFNQAAGGTANGYRYAVDSNYDWGQDLTRFAAWAEEMRKDPSNKMDRIAVDYFGGGNPGYLLGKDLIENWWAGRGNPADVGIHWLAVSVNNLQGGLGPTVRGFDRNPADAYAWLADIRENEGGFGGVPRPDYRVGTSILIYKL
jgi:hypothetical protein